MTRLVPFLSIIFMLVAPFGEGGRDPRALVLLHTLAFVLILGVIMMAIDRGGLAIPDGGPRRAATLLELALLLALASALRAPYPLAAALGLLDLAVAIGLFCTALCLPADERALDRLRLAALASTSLQAVIAIGRYPQGGQLAAGASFLNPNHLAAFLNLGLLLAADRAVDRLGERKFRPAVLWIALAVLHLVAIGLLASRGAFFGLALALGALLALRSRAWSKRARLVSVGVLIAVGSLGVASLALRFGRVDDPYRYDRLRIWEAALGMAGERPFLGYGPGMFRHVAPAHNFASQVGPFRYEKWFSGAHSAPLTLGVENGIPAAGCLAAAAILALVALWRARPGSIWTAGKGLAIALVAPLAQALVEDLQERPALTLVPALLVGVALSALRERAGAGEERGTSGVGGAGPARAPDAPSPSEDRAALKAAAGLTAIYLFIASVALPYLADRDARGALRAGGSGLGKMERAARLNPLHPDYRQDLAMAVLNSGPPEAERYAQAAIDLLEARRLKPIDYRNPLLLGRLEARLGRPLFQDETASARAIVLYREAIRLAPLDPRPLCELADLLGNLGRPDEALATIERALTIEPHFVHARILECSLYLRLGRRAEARASLERLEQTRNLLREERFDSGYALDLAADDPGARPRREEGGPPAAATH